MFVQEKVLIHLRYRLKFFVPDPHSKDTSISILKNIYFMKFNSMNYCKRNANNIH